MPKPPAGRKRGGRPARPKPKWNERLQAWQVRVSLDETRRKVVTLFDIPHENEALALIMAQQASDRLRGGEFTDVPSEVETLSEWCGRWIEERKVRGLTSVPSDSGRLRTHVYPKLGPVAMRAVTRDQIEHLVDDLDKKVRAGAISWKSAANVWGVVSKMFDDAVNAKSRRFRVRSDDPTVGVRGPDRGSRPAKQYLYPSEFSALVSCAEVPLRYRVLYAVAVYTFARAGEIEALTWDDVDLEHKAIHINKAVDRHTGKVKSTKTGETRRIPIEPKLIALLEKLYEERRKGMKSVCWIPSDEVRAKMLRSHLVEAGVERKELFGTDARRKQMTFHDLRATGITWCAVRGDEPRLLSFDGG